MPNEQKLLFTYGHPKDLDSKLIAKLRTHTRRAFGYMGPALEDQLQEKRRNHRSIVFVLQCQETNKVYGWALCQKSNWEPGRYWVDIQYFVPMACRRQGWGSMLMDLVIDYLKEHHPKFHFVLYDTPESIKLREKFTKAFGKRVKQV